MRLRVPLLLAFALPCLLVRATWLHASGTQLVDAYPSKARFAPSEPVELVVELAGEAVGTEQVSATIGRLGLTVGQCIPLHLATGASGMQTLHCAVPQEDFQGYLVTVQLSD